MATNLTKSIQQVCSLTHLADSDLLHRFVQHKDAAAFEALLVRHGPLVLSVCRRILKNAADADDAFQATFLVLLRTGRSIRNAASLPSWLHGVARRTALHAKRAAARRRTKEAAVVPKAEIADSSEDLNEVLDEEIACLAEPYRAAILLCDLEGKTRKEAARELGCAEGTVASRLARGRSLLAGRLSRRGVTLGAMMLCSAVPASLVACTVKLVTGPVSAPVAALTEGVLKIMLLNKLKRVVGVLVLFVVLTAGMGFSLSAWPGQTNGEGKPASSQAKEAIRTATAQAVLDLYQLNDAAADEQFTDKRVRVSGTLYQVRKVAGRTPSYQLKLEYLKGIQPSPGDLALVFEFPPEARKQLSSLVLQGQAVTVEGRCQGRATVDGSEAILFRDCRLVAMKAPADEATKKQPRP